MAQTWTWRWWANVLHLDTVPRDCTHQPCLFLFQRPACLCTAMPHNIMLRRPRAKCFRCPPPSSLRHAPAELRRVSPDTRPGTHIPHTRIHTSTATVTRIMRMHNHTHIHMRSARGASMNGRMNTSSTSHVLQQSVCMLRSHVSAATPNNRV